MISGYVTFSKQNNKKKSQEKDQQVWTHKVFLNVKKYKLLLGKNHNKYVSHAQIFHNKEKNAKEPTNIF